MLEGNLVLLCDDRIFHQKTGWHFSATASVGASAKQSLPPADRTPTTLGSTQL